MDYAFLPRSPVLFWRSSLFELCGTTDRTHGLRLGAKHGLECRLFNVLNGDIIDSLSVLEYEHSKLEDGLITFAIFFVKGATLVAVELSVPKCFQAEARTIFDSYADIVRQKLTRAILEKTNKRDSTKLMVPSQT